MFYKCTDPEIVAAVNDVFERRNHLDNEALRVAKLFHPDAVGMIFTYPDREWFGGIKCSPPLPSTFWTYPGEHSSQRPRKRLKSGTNPSQETKDDLKRIQQLWEEETKKLAELTVDLGVVHELFGLKALWYAFESFKMSRAIGALYISTSVKMPETCVEILESEYKEATEKKNVSKE